MRRPDGPTIFLGSVIVGVVVLFGCLTVFYSNGQANNDRDAASELTLDQIPVDGRRSYQYLQDICAIGPRVSGSPGMQAQQEMLQKHFQDLGGQVSMQTFAVRHPLNGVPVNLSNMIVQWHPERQQRVLLCAHYDTRPYPDRDRRNPRGTFIGANDGASGTAVLAELAHYMPQLESPYGVDFVLFDGEEFVFDDRRDQYFLGSEHFARQYVANRPEYRYRWGVLLDMVGDADLQLYQEVNSMRWRDTRPLVESIWKVAEQLGVQEFIDRTRHEIRDDHLPLRNVGGIPTCDIIDFDYPRPGAHRYWHTEQDTPDKCSPLSLAKVGWVVLEWLRRVR